jgi:hypothetical protein
MLLLIGTPFARAQDAPGGEGEAASAEVPSVAVAEGPSPEQEEEARTRFRQGLVLARGGDCDAALAEFEASYRLVARPNTLFNMAQCEERLHRYDLAVQQYQHYLDTAPPEAEDRDTVMATLESLRGLLGTIHVEVNTPSDVWLGDRIVGVAPGDVLVPGGRHALELRASGYLPERREVEVAARQRVELTVTLVTAETHIENTVIEETTIEETHVHEYVTVERPPVPVEVFATGVTLTVLTGIGGLAAGLSALISHDQTAAMDPRLPHDTGGIRDAALAADILFVTCGVFAVGTIVLGVLTDFEGAPAPERERRDPSDEPEDLFDDEESASVDTHLFAAPIVSDTTVGVVAGGSF